MPELPEVETVARTLAPQVCGRRIVAVEVLNAGTWQGTVEAGAVAGQRLLIAGTGRRGKLLLLHLVHGGEAGPVPQVEREIPVPESASLWPLHYTAQGAGSGRPSLCGSTPREVTALAFHLRMTGRLFVYPAGTEPEKHTRLILGLDDGRRVFFDDVRRFGQARALCTEELERWDFWRKMGPEPLEMTDEAFAARLVSRGAVKALLLNQSVVAGIGNIYADESLFRAGIRPDTPAASLSEARRRRLHRALVEILLTSIRECGSSIRDYRTARGDVGAFQNRFFVYGRADGRCLVCGSRLASASVAGRTTVWCPRCQKA